LWQQHKSADDDSYGAYSQMMVEKTNSYIDELDRADHMKELAQ
jgi:hypothetical protein